jgi:uncharacterized membrane protein YbhN (UPF0104 family)
MNDNSVTLAGDRAPSIEQKRRSYGAFALRAGFGLAVLAFLLWYCDARSIFRTLARERVSFFTATVALYVGGQAMSAFRWQLLARLNGLGGLFRDYLAYYFIGMSTNLFLPGLIGGDALRAVYLGRRTDRVGDAIASVIADRGVGLLALFWFAATCALVVPGGGLPRSVARLVLGVGLLSLLGYLLAPLIASPLQCMRGRIAGLLAPIVPYLRKPFALIPAIVLSIILQASLAFCQYLLARGLRLDIPLHTFMLIVPIANAVTSLPVTINGLGVREAAYLVLPLIGGLVGIIAFVRTGVPQPIVPQPAAVGRD